jgi:hypothetical protein
VAVNWTNISSLATGGGTLVLAVATFAAVRSANRAARAAERSLLAGLRPLLVPSRLDDGQQKVFFGDGWHVMLSGGRGVAQEEKGTVYLAASLRNAGTGIGVLHGWLFHPGDYRSDLHPDLETFTRQTRDLYIPSGDTGFWQGALRDPTAPDYKATLQAIEDRQPVTIDLLYGDYEGGQRVVSRFVLRPGREEPGTGQPGWLLSVIHHWNIDRPDPRS